MILLLLWTRLLFLAILVALVLGHAWLALRTRHES
jgi:hypothetical protein